MTRYTYFEGGGWLFPDADFAMNPFSTMPHARTPGLWTLEKIPSKRFDQNIQGWKIHVCVHPDGQAALFHILSKLLCNARVAHKFLPFSAALRHETGVAAWNRITPTQYDGEGKSCVVYPRDPRHLIMMYHWIDGEIRRFNAELAAEAARTGQQPDLLRPFPGGVKGDMALGNSGFIYTRYGGFAGSMTMGTRKRVYNPFTGHYEKDPRYERPYPDFAANIPGGIRALM